MPQQSFLKTLVQAAIGLALVLVVWELAARSRQDFLVLPTVPAVFGRLGTLWGDPGFSNHVRASLQTFALGFLPAVMIALPLGLALRVWSVPRLIVAPLALVLGAAPLVAIAPLLIVWLGVGQSAGTSLVFWMSLAGIAFAMINRGAAPTGQHQESFAREAAPAIAAGLRAGILFGATGLTVMEMLASNIGLGFFILEAHTLLNVESALAGVVALALPTMAVILLLQALELQLAPRA